MSAATGRLTMALAGDWRGSRILLGFRGRATRRVGASLEGLRVETRRKGGHGRKQQKTPCRPNERRRHALSAVRRREGTVRSRALYRGLRRPCASTGTRRRGCCKNRRMVPRRGGGGSQRPLVPVARVSSFVGIHSENVNNCFSRRPPSLRRGWRRGRPCRMAS